MAKKPDDDARFAQLIQDEYGVTVDGPGLPEAAPPKPRRFRRRRPAVPAPADDEPAWFSLDKALDEAEPEYEPWEQFQPPTPPPLAWPRRPLVIAGIALFLAALAIAIAWVAGAPVPLWLRGAGGLAVGGGLACLLLSLPRRRPLDDDGVLL